MARNKGGNEDGQVEAWVDGVALLLRQVSVERELVVLSLLCQQGQEASARNERVAFARTKRDSPPGNTPSASLARFPLDTPPRAS